MRPETEQELAHLLLVELLAYQFASPVRWIETQDVILNGYKAERLVEIGPSPTLAGMAMRTIKAKYETHDAALNLQRQVLCYAKDAKEIYYIPDPATLEPPPSADAPSKEDPAAAAAASAAVMDAAAAAHIPPPPAASAGPAQAVPDEPISALDLIRGLIAQKLKKPLDQVPVQKAIKDLVGGKSTLQNEILGDLGKEFGATPEKPEETPIDELAAQFQVAFNGQLGKHSTSLIQRMISSKMPGGFNLSAVRKYLNERWGLGQGRQDAILVLALTEEPAARLTAEPDAKSFFDTLANKYAASAGISLASAASSGAGGGAGAGGAVAIDAAALEKITGGQNQLIERQLELFAKYLQIDLRKGDKAFVDQQAASQVLQSQLDLWLAEHGDFYASGIAPCFSPLKARVYDSSWNWARQDALCMFFDIVFGRLNVIDREIVSQCILVMNRSTPQLLDFMQYHIDHCPENKGSTYALAKQLGYQLIENCKEALGADPVYKNVMYPTGPHTTIDPKGTLKYEEVHRPSVRKLEQYVKEMISGYKIPAKDTQKTIKDDLSKVYELLKKQPQFASSKTSADFGKIYQDIINTVDSSSSSNQSVETIPFLHLKSFVDEKWEYDNNLTQLYLDSLEKASKDGVTYKGKYALVTGAGAGSIGAEILQGLLSGGANVIVTTSRYSRQVTEFYQALYVKYGASGSSLIVVPFNQGSKQDVEKLVDYIYDPKNGLGWDLDIIVPFAAIPENGREIDSIDSKSELAHRIMLTNLLRLLGSIKTQKLERGYTTRPAQVILPLSPNHGTFGSDGLYSESKLGLETLFNRWHSESWGSFLTICGAIIGWTRGTGLMSANNSIAEGIEKHGVRTFSQQEMAFNILGLMTPAITNLCQTGPVFADLNGGLQFLPKLKELSSQLRAELLETSEIRRAVSTETALEHKVVNGEDAERFHNKVKVKARANLNIEFPKLKSFKELAHLSSDLKGMVDLEKVIVVTGFSEVGPWGNARTRWDMEAHGKFSLEGCIEMAWIMGLIKHHSGPLKGKPGVAYSGWVDSKTGEPVDDRDVKAKYEKYILEHSGIRLIEPELFHGYDPHKKELLQEIVVEHDLEPFETSKEGAEDFKRQQGDKTEIFEIEGSDQWSVRLLKGASLFVPKALNFDRLVAGQIPTGWDARRYGIGEDIISQVDPVTLFVLVSTVETLLACGITDPYEFYKYVHVSELGNCTGSGMGGLSALKSMFKDRFMDKPVQMDILQESFINTMSAWVNMLMLSSSGPIKTPVGACATAVESLDVGCETILSGKARVCIVGGFDDFQEDSSYEFANMKATSNSEVEFAHGRTPSEMSRPATTSRNGFMESQGAGTQIIMTAKLALEMGVPIYGILAMTATASDKIGRSVPAPGRGILTTARERRGKLPSPLLDIKYRRRQLDLRRRQIKEWTESEILYVEQEAAALEGDEETKKTYLGERIEHLKREAARQERDALNSLGNDFWRKDPEIAPMRGALATWNLTIDDIGVASFHGTSTQANDKNESKTYQSMMEHMGRSKGNVLYCVFQKYLTGHPKGAAGAWMFNGALQMLNTGLVPGNRNADNIDKNFVDFDMLLYPSRSIQTDGVKAVTLTSFGFGQKGAQAIAIHPDYLYATLDQEVYEAYQTKVASRYQKTYRYFHSSLVQNSMFIAKNDPPYAPDQEGTVYLDPTARVDDKYSYPRKPAKIGPSKETEETVANLTREATSGTKHPRNIGVDVESLSSINIDNETFITRNFTPKEIEYCQSSPSPLSSFTGTWSAKEAVFKALGVQSKGAGAQLNGIEIIRDAKGIPTVQLHGDAASAASKAGVKNVKVSISHDDFQAVAVAVSDA